MKTLQEIKDEVESESGWKEKFKTGCEIKDIEIIIEIIAKRYAYEASKQSLINGCKNAKISCMRGSGLFKYVIDEKSILNESNIILL